MYLPVSCEKIGNNKEWQLSRGLLLRFVSIVIFIVNGVHESSFSRVCEIKERGGKTKN